MRDDRAVESTNRAAAILIVDDEQGILDAFRSMFRREGHMLHLFTSPGGALEFLGREHVDIIMSDLRMPEMSGMEFLSRTVDLCPRATRIMVSGYEDRETILRSLAKGLAQHYVMKPWEDHELKKLIQGVTGQLLDPRLLKLKGIFGGLDAFPAPLLHHMELRSILARPDASIVTITEEIEKNPPVVAKILQISNSVYYGARKPITTVRDAIQFVGTASLENLVMAIEAFQSFGSCPDPWAKQQIDEMWRTAIARAHYAKTIASRWDGFQDGHVVYAASVLQDIGLVVRAYTDPAGYRKLLEGVRHAEAGILESDAEVFGETHDEIGSMLLTYWNLPDSIAAAVGRHHAMNPEDNLTLVLQIADVLSSNPTAQKIGKVLEPLVAEWRHNLDLSNSSNA